MNSEEFKLKTTGAIRARIAPSPTGYLHIGTARTALFNYLFAKKNQGVFVLRIEDTDQERSLPEYEKDIIENLKWLGLVWDEGPDIGGDYGPYRQSEKLDVYKRYLETLLAEDKAYYCFCSAEELEAQRQYQLSQGLAPKYSGKCANLDADTVKQYLAEGRPGVIRFRTEARKVSFNDMVCGKVEFDTSLLGDMVIAKDLDTPLYNFAVVVDDYEMKISHVIRGDDHLSNTPKQILIQEALGLPQPIYTHMPMILGTDRSKLSKRHGATAISEYRKEGYLPEALVNFMVLLGWNPGEGEQREIYALPSLVKDFSLERIQKSGAIFSIKKLDFLNGFYIRQKSLERLLELSLPYFVEAGLIQEETFNAGYLKGILAIYQERLKKLSEVVSLTDFFFKDTISYDRNLLRWKDMSDKDIKQSLVVSKKILSKIKEKDWQQVNIEKALLDIKKFKDRGILLWPLRVALTGKEASANPFEVAAILGRDKTLERIKEAEKLICTKG